MTPAELYEAYLAAQYRLDLMEAQHDADQAALQSARTECDSAWRAYQQSGGRLPRPTGGTGEYPAFLDAEDSAPQPEADQTGSGALSIAGHPHDDASAGPQTVVLQPRCKWTLALDDVPGRTFANTHNLGLLSKLSYCSMAWVRRFFEDRFTRAIERSAIGPTDFTASEAGGEILPIVRRAPDADQSGTPFSTVYWISRTNGATDTQLFVTANSSCILIAVRGTEFALTWSTFQDLFTTDLMGTPVDWPFASPSRQAGPLKIHAGFNMALTSILEDLRGHLTSLGFSRDDRRPIYLTGHSLGGAIAALIACWLRSHVFTITQRSQTRIHLYTYGQPRIGNIHMARAFWRDGQMLAYHRFARTNDVVPMVPRQDTTAQLLGRGFPMLAGVAMVLCPPDCDYRHFGQLYRVREGGSPPLQAVSATQTEIESSRQLADELAILTQTVPDVSIGAHDMLSSYLALIRTEFDANYAAWSGGQAGAVPFTDGRDELDRFRAAAAPRGRRAA